MNQFHQYAMIKLRIFAEVNLAPSWISSLVVAKGLEYLNKTMSHAVRATHDRQVMVKRSDKMWSVAGGNYNPPSILGWKTS